VTNLEIENHSSLLNDFEESQPFWMSENKKSSPLKSGGNATQNSFMQSVFKSMTERGTLPKVPLPNPDPIYDILDFLESDEKVYPDQTEAKMQNMIRSGSLKPH